ncbi:SGNH/GDSL hydrolase family protein [Caballeronia sp. LP006]|uniref:SGNH/GDSL hydrolase family protein n=1 Tax=Caballeronia sp. LP006 TaxID=3038552 RepID=UPI00285B5CC2|nr:SGNH/GDSL hydrolase family protein [Caballeronia sp. LP006]MDR5826688.1 SGNH/GDSL hydrolase family protein [Caballeronia sp. LP006]
MSERLFFRAAGRAMALLCAAYFVLAAPNVSASRGDGRDDGWISTWTASADRNNNLTTPQSFNASTTIRQVVHLSVGGDRVRVRLTNEFGTTPVTVGPVHIALSVGGAKIAPNSDRTLTFGGKTTVTLYAGAPILSDPVDIKLPPFADIAVSFFLPDATQAQTVHQLAVQNAYVSSGDNTATADQPSPQKYTNRFFLSGVLIDTDRDTPAVVTFGDSITDGYASTVDASRRWPDDLSQRLNGGSARRSYAVLNQGISGNRVIKDGSGISALARYDRDVLSQSNVKLVIFLEGINDIGWPQTVLDPTAGLVPAQDIIDGYKQIIARTHLRGIKIVGGTLTPFHNALQGTPNQGYWTQQKEAIRQTVNAWIRTSRAFDAVVDFDAVLRDPAHPIDIRAVYDSGDHLHPNDAGYAAMANAVDLSLLYRADDDRDRDHDHH